MIYLDNSATTPMYKELLPVIEKYACENYYNPSALYNKSASVKQDLKLAKGRILKMLGASNGTLVITASGTEADNMALFGSKKFKDGRVIISAVEHSAIYQSAKKLESQGIKVDFAPVDRYGKVKIDEFEKLLDKDVMLVSIMHVCNETGALNDIEKLVKLTKSKSPRALFHSDGVQAVGKISVNLTKLGVDMYSLSSHKFHGMKGVGALYLRQGVNITPIIFGGGQESGLRSATENVSGIMCMAQALEITLKKLNYSQNKGNIEYLRDKLLSINSNFIINTNISESACSILSFSIPNTRGEVLVHMMEDNGVIIGTGSACSASKGSSRIATELGLDKVYHSGMIRVSISVDTTREELEKFIEVFEKQYNLLKGYIGK